jgi:zinc protease
MKLNRAIRPQSKVPRKFDLPSIESFELINGLNVFYSPKPKLPIVKLNLMVPAGSRFDAYGHEGLAYLTSLLIDEGAGKYNALQLASEIDKLGSSIEVSTSVDYIFLSLTSLTENFERTLELFSLIFKSPLFDNESFEREKKKHLTKILQSFDDSSYIAANAFQRNIFKGTPYDKPILGFSNSVESFDLTLVKDFYSRFFHSPSSNLIAVGAVEEITLLKLLNKYLGDFQFKNDSSRININRSKGKARLFFVNKEGAAQSEIIAGHLTKNRNEDDYLAAKVANSILGGQFTSRINLNLREDKGYTYGAHSALSYNKQFGYFTISTSVQSEYTLNSIAEIRNEINLIRENITDAEIAFAKSSLVRQFPSYFETYSQLVQRITTKVIHELDDYYDTYIQNVWDLTSEEIQRAAIEYFRPDELCFFVVGDKEIIYRDLQQINDLEIIELDKLGNLI